jgi:hypothetical protein
MFSGNGSGIIEILLFSSGLGNIKLFPLKTKGQKYDEVSFKINLSATLAVEVSDEVWVDEFKALLDVVVDAVDGFVEVLVQPINESIVSDNNRHNIFLFIIKISLKLNYI